MTSAFFFTAYETFLLENTQHSQHRVMRQWIGQVLAHFGHASRTHVPQGFHNVSFAVRKSGARQKSPLKP